MFMSQAVFEKSKPLPPGAPKPLSASQRKKKEKNRLWWERQRERQAALEAQGCTGAANPPVNPDAKAQCKFFKIGKCSKTDCSFSHDFVPDKIAELCKFYLMDFCSKGSACVYYHGDWPCKFFHSYKNCYQGASCKFSHLPLTDVTRPLLEKSLADSVDAPKLNGNTAVADASITKPPSEGTSSQSSLQPSFHHLSTLPQTSSQHPPPHSQPSSASSCLPLQAHAFLPSSAPMNSHTPAARALHGCIPHASTTGLQVAYTLRPIDVEASHRPSLPTSLRPPQGGDATQGSGVDPRVHWYSGGTGLGAACKAAVVQVAGAVDSAPHEAGGAVSGYYLRPCMIVCDWSSDAKNSTALCPIDGLPPISDASDRAQPRMGFYSETVPE